MINLAKVNHILKVYAFLEECIFQSLERAQADGEELRTKVQYSLFPMLFEQVVSRLLGAFHCL